MKKKYLLPLLFICLPNFLQAGKSYEKIIEEISGFIKKVQKYTNKKNANSYDESNDESKQLQILLHLAVFLGEIDITKFIARSIIESGGQIDAVDQNGQTPLHIAVHKGLSEIVEFFVEKGANVDVQDFLQQTPLNKVIDGFSPPDRDKYKKIVQFLLDKGAKVDVQNLRNKNTP